MKRSRVNKKISVILPIMLLLIGSAVYLYQSTIKNNPKQLIPSSYELTYHDSELPGFSLMYNPNTWFIERQEDVTTCNDRQCSDPYGRTVTFTHKQYTQDYPNKRVALTITVIHADRLDTTDTATPLCVPNERAVPLGNSWYRIHHAPPEQSAAEKLWELNFYLHSTIRYIDGMACIYGGYSSALQESLPVLYQGKPTMIDIQLKNTVSADLNNVADDIVTSIHFK